MKLKRKAKMEKASVGGDLYCEENRFKTCVALAIKYNF